MTDLTFTEEEMKNLHPSIRKEVIDLLNSTITLDLGVDELRDILKNFGYDTPKPFYKSGTPEEIEYLHSILLEDNLEYWDIPVEDKRTNLNSVFMEVSTLIGDLINGTPTQHIPEPILKLFNYNRGRVKIDKKLIGMWDDYIVEDMYKVCSCGSGNKYKWCCNKKRKLYEITLRFGTPNTQKKTFYHYEEPKIFTYPKTENSVKFIQELNKRVTQLGIKTERGTIGYTEHDTDKGLLQLVRSITSVIETNEFRLQLSPMEDGIKIVELNTNKNIRNKGVGSRVLQELNDISNKLDVPIYLLPIPFDFDKNQRHSIRRRLVRFYERNGYKTIKNSRYMKYEPNTNQVEHLNEYRMVG